MTVTAEPATTRGAADRGDDLEFSFELDDLDQPLRDQLAQLEAMPALSRTCWKPYPNNFVWVHVPRARLTTSEEFRRTRAHALAALNWVDAQVVRWLRSVIQNAGTPEQHDAASRHFDAWQRNDDAGSNLIGVDHALAIMQILGDSDDLPGRLRSERSDVVTAIRGLSSTIRCGIRFAIYAPYQLAAAVAETVAAELEQQDVLHIVSSIEVAKALDADIPSNEIWFPAVMVYVDSGTIAGSRQAVSTLVSVLAAVGTSIGIDVAGSSRTRHAFAVAPSIEVAQGFRLLKRYLEPLGLLDDLYLAEANHAIARPRSPSEEAATDALSSLAGIR